MTAEKAKWTGSDSLGVGDALQFSQTILRVHCDHFQHQQLVQFEWCVAETLQTITACLPVSKWICLLLRIVLQDALMTLKVSVDDVTACPEGRNKGSGVAETVLENDETGSGGKRA